MSVAEIKSEIAKLSPAELNELWEVIENALDNAEADEALREGKFSPLEDVEKRIGL